MIILFNKQRDYAMTGKTKILDGELFCEQLKKESDDIVIMNKKDLEYVKQHMRMTAETLSKQYGQCVEKLLYGDIQKFDRIIKKHKNEG